MTSEPPTSIATPTSDPRTEPLPPRRSLTTIVATVGPATTSAEMLGRLMEAGVRVFRFNFSHGELSDHEERLRTIRSVAARLDVPVAVLGDLQGPKIRIGDVTGEGIDAVTGSTIVIRREPILAVSPEPGHPPVFSSTYEHLVDDVDPGQRLLINDGAVRTIVVSKEPDLLRCAVTHGGVITSGKGINLPDTDLTVDTITERDRVNVRWSVAHELDYLALSFVRAARDVTALRALVAEAASACGRPTLRLPIVAKIELPSAVANIEEILVDADAIMVARGDLGVEMDLARVPVIQKQLIAAAHDHGRPCIVATQMLESMISRPAPTRAEASDVANAIFEEVDAVMLSGETAVGSYPAVTVDQMRRIARATEAHLATERDDPSRPRLWVETRHPTAALAHGVWSVARDVGAKCIAVWSQHGGGARYLSQNRFRIPILAVTSDARVARQMQLLRGVSPVRMEVPDGLRAFTARVDELIRGAGWAEPGDACILVAGEPLGQPGVTNSLAILVVGDPESGFGVR